MALKRKEEKKLRKAKKPKPVAKKKPKKTIKLLNKTVNYSLCIPTSLISNCQNLEQITNSVYQVAKAATLFNVAEIVVLSIEDTKLDKKRLSNTMLIASLLQFFVTPPYLVNTVFKKQYMKYFKYAVKLPRLSALPFMRFLKEDKGRYREGVAVRMSKPIVNGQIPTKSNKEFKQTKYINIGKQEMLELKSQLVPINVRVTVDIVDKRVVSPEEAYGDFVGAKSSFGYHVRTTNNFGKIFTESPFPDGYSQSIWINSGDYYYDNSLKKYRKLETQVAMVDKIVSSGTADSTANLLFVFGKWDHIKKSFMVAKDQFPGCDGAHQFFDGQLELPGAVPQGNIPISDSCMIALTLAQ